MPKKGIREQIREASEKAITDVKKKVKKKKRPYVKKIYAEGEKPKAPSKWITDVWGGQGEVYFDGENYWGTALVARRDNPKIKDVVTIMWSQETWEERQQAGGRPVKEVEKTKKTRVPKKTKVTKKTKTRIKKGETV